MAAPGRTQLVVPGQRGVRVLDDVEDGEVARQECGQEGGKTQRHQDELSRGECGDGSAPRGVRGTEIADRREAEGRRQAQDGGEMPEFNDHGRDQR